jgi:integrase
MAFAAARGPRVKSPRPRDLPRVKATLADLFAPADRRLWPAGAGATARPPSRRRERPLGAALKTPVPVPASLIAECSAQISIYGRYTTLLTGVDEGQLSPWAIERAMRKARKEVQGLPAGFRYHDLRHYFASLLIASGADVKTVQARLRHASAKTTLDTYGHIWPDRDESTRAAVDAVVTAYQTEQRRNSATTEP